MRQQSLQGSVLLVALAAGAVFCPPPTDLVGLLLLATGILILERFAVALERLQPGHPHSMLAPTVLQKRRTRLFL